MTPIFDPYEYILHRQQSDVTQCGSRHHKRWYHLRIVELLPVKQIKFPKSNFVKSRKSRFSSNIFYFATEDTRRTNGLETKHYLIQKLSVQISAIVHFWTICQIHHPITIQKEQNQLKTIQDREFWWLAAQSKQFSYNQNGQLGSSLFS